MGKTVRKIILSVDRLDYTKGIPQRLEAFDLFLEKYPEYKKQVTLIIVAVPSRTGVETYKMIKQQVDELVGRINGKHGTIDWMPVWYLYRFLPFKNIVSLYNMADVALVTPLRDGMNLIAKEYIAARKDGLGVLVLSEMAGAMSELAEAVIVNPNNKEDVADSLKIALTMPEEEQIERNKILKKRLQRYNVITWAKDFYNSLYGVVQRQEEISTKRLTKIRQDLLLKQYAKSKERLIFLDYDGTLVRFRDRPEMAKPDEEIYKILHVLIKDSKNEVILVSGRDKHTLDKWFGHLNIGLSAEHGVWIKSNRKTWSIVEPMQNNWKVNIFPILDLYVDKTPGSFIEEKSYSLVWHYRKSNHELGSVRARELKEDLYHLTNNLDLTILEGNKVIEIKNRGINKGRAAMRWLSDNDWDFILALGDDWTDEDLFEAMPESAYTIKVGLDASKAKYYVTGHKMVRELLQAIGKT
jgi:trehalose 6-phosphate synthase/phosphatase